MSWTSVVPWTVLDHEEKERELIQAFERSDLDLSFAQFKKYIESLPDEE